MFDDEALEVWLICISSSHKVVASFENCADVSKLPLPSATISPNAPPTYNVAPLVTCK